jgi:hypothetical protein
VFLVRYGQTYIYKYHSNKPIDRIFLDFLFQWFQHGGHENMYVGLRPARLMNTPESLWDIKLV